jgi:hypothetical protein
MRGRIQSGVALWLAIAGPLSAVIVDRVAVSIGNSVITESQIDLSIHVTAFLNGEQPDFRPESKRKTADRLVDQLLVRNELQLAHFPEPPQAAVERLLARVKRDRFAGKDADYRAELARTGLTETELRKQIAWQITFLRFVDARFRPGVQITDQDIQDYFQKVIVPSSHPSHPDQKLAIEDYRDRIERVLTERRVDQQLNAWLKETRSRASVSFHEEAFQ